MYINGQAPGKLTGHGDNFCPPGLTVRGKFFLPRILVKKFCLSGKIRCPLAGNVNKTNSLEEMSHVSSWVQIDDIDPW